MLTFAQLMNTVVAIIFWISLLGLLHTYVLFPLLMRLLLKLKTEVKEEVADNLFKPMVSVVMAAYNEEKVIIQKLESVIKSNYPSDKLEIIVGSDCSNDGTDVLVQEFSQNHPQVKFIRFNSRTGKPAIINQLVKHSKGEFLIITDANVMFDAEAISSMMNRFTVAEVGLVDSNMVNIGLMKSGISSQEKQYIQTEVLTKYAEGEIWGSMMGPFGGCYAIRKSLFSDIPANFLVDDFYVCMKILEQGYHSVSSLKAIVYEEASHNLWIEYRRKMRIATGNFQNLAKFSKMIFKGRGIGFCFMSHKVLRWKGPVLMLLLFFSSFAAWWLSVGINPVLCLGIFGAMSLSLMLLLADRLLNLFQIHVGLLRLNTHFLVMNAAMLKGMFRYFKGVKSGVWQPTSRTQNA